MTKILLRLVILLAGSFAISGVVNALFPVNIALVISLVLCFAWGYNFSKIERYFLNRGK